MDAKQLLERRLASANDRLRAAQRDGQYTTIVPLLKVRDALLDELHPPTNPD